MSRARRLASWLAFLASLAAPGLSPAQGIPTQCGPDCSTPGRYVLCRDSFDTSGAASGGAELSAFLEAMCVGFTPAEPVELQGFVGLFGPGDLLIGLLEVFQDAGQAAPQGAPIFEAGVGIPDTPAAGFSGLLFSGPTVSASFRICLRQQLDGAFGTRPILFDSDGIVPGANTSFVPGMGWAFAEARGLPHDLILRAIVESPNRKPWLPGGECVRPDPDAGVAEDAAGADAAPDAGASEADAAAVDAAPDAGVSEADATVADAAPEAGVGEDAALPDAVVEPDATLDAALPDAAVELDATLEDAAAADAAGLDADGPADLGAAPDASLDAGAADVGAPDAGSPAPTISRITPNQGSSAAATDVVVRGSGFFAGLRLEIGTIAATDVEVPGESTILARVPANIAAGTYDVVVTNPDGQRATLPAGFTVSAAVAPVPDDCGCTAASERPSGLLFALALALALRRRRRA